MNRPFESKATIYARQKLEQRQEQEASELRRRYQDDDYLMICKLWNDESNHPY